MLGFVIVDLPRPRPRRRHRAAAGPFRPPLLGVTVQAWSPARMTYDLRGLRLHGLIERIPRSRRYRVTDAGILTTLCYQRTHACVLRPTLAAVFDPDHPAAVASNVPSRPSIARSSASGRAMNCPHNLTHLSTSGRVKKSSRISDRVPEWGTESAPGPAQNRQPPVHVRPPAKSTISVPFDITSWSTHLELSYSVLSFIKSRLISFVATTCAGFVAARAGAAHRAHAANASTGSARAIAPISTAATNTAE